MFYQSESVLSIKVLIWYNNMNYSVKEKEYDATEVYICDSGESSDSYSRIFPFE